MVMVMVFIYRIRSIYIFKCGLHYFSTRVRSDISIALALVAPKGALLVLGNYFSEAFPDRVKAQSANA